MRNKNLYITTIAFIVSIGGLLLGISANVSGASEFYRSYFDLKSGSFLEGLGVSIAMLSTFIGTFNGGVLSDKIGRKHSLLLAAFLFCFCTLGSGLANSFTFFLIFRFIGGLGIGISLVVVPMYIAEFSPSEKRGFLVSFFQLNIGIGFLLAYVLNSIVISQVTDTDVVWRWMLGVGVIFPVIYFNLLLFVPESPRWLILNGKEDAARRVMVKMVGETFARNQIAKMKQSALQAGDQEVLSFKNSWKLLFSSKMRLVVLVAFSVAFFQMASGFNSVMFFAPKIFRLAGFSGTGSFFQSNIIGITMVVMTVVSMLLIDRLGRKPLLLIGVFIMSFSLLTTAYIFKQSTYTVNQNQFVNIVGEKNNAESKFISGVLHTISGETYINETDFFHQFRNGIQVKTKELIEFKQNNPLEVVAFDNLVKEGMIEKQATAELANEVGFAIYSNYRDRLLDASISINSFWFMVAIVGFIIGFSISLGPITWILLSEVFPGSVRGLGISIASTLNGISSFVVVTLLPIELEYLGSSTTFLIYGIMMLIFIFVVIKWFPETKGKSLEQIEEELVKK